MNDGEKQVGVFERQDKKNDVLQRYLSCSLFIFQSFWVRCCSILFDGNYGKHLESQFGYVLYCGFFFWFLHLLIQAIK